MRKPENTFIAGVHKYLSPKLYWEKMNNPYSSGTPDVWYSGTKGDLWVEYKYLPRVPQRGDVDALKLLSPLQAKWLSDRYSEGRTVRVCIGCPDGGIMLRSLEWLCELTALEFRERLCTRKELAFQIEQITTR